MESILVNPKTRQEAKLIKDLLDKMNVSTNIISDEEKEDLGLIVMMKEVDRSDLVSRDEIIAKLRS